MNDRNEKDKLLESNYDGIQEYDNQLPRWWVWLFYITIVFGCIYATYQHGFAPTQTETLAAQLEELQTLRKAAAPAVEGTEVDLGGFVQVAANVEKGKALYIGKCAACHGISGGGMIGPNLTDDYWIHGGDLGAIKRIIVEGVVEKGMVPWQNLMSPEEINQVVAFVWSLHGTTPDNPKAPQGELSPRAK